MRDLAERSDRRLVERNFERDPALVRLFSSADPRRVSAEVGVVFGVDLDPGRAVLFLDEIRAAPTVLSRLRRFAEELPELPVIAAGSLLEFALADPQHSVPVGRISYLHVEPMTVREFLEAHGQDRRIRLLAEWTPAEALSPVVHERATAWYERFAMVGGMQGVVAADVAHGEPDRCRRLQADLVATFRDDFAKYVGRMAPRILDGVLMSVARPAR